MTLVVDRPRAVGRAERAVEHGEVLVLEPGRALNRLLGVDVLGDGLDLVVAVREVLERLVIVLLTILIMPPPTRRLYLMSAMSGSMPVVSQSIMKPIVPVGASTVACAFRYPNCSPSSTASSHDDFAV